MSSAWTLGDLSLAQENLLLETSECQKFILTLCLKKWLFGCTQRKGGALCALIWLQLCVCVHVHVCMYVHACMCACARMRVYVCMCVHACRCVHVHM